VLLGSRFGLLSVGFPWVGWPDAWPWRAVSGKNEQMDCGASCGAGGGRGGGLETERDLGTVAQEQTDRAHSSLGGLGRVTVCGALCPVLQARPQNVPPQCWYPRSMVTRIEDLRTASVPDG